MIRSYRKLLTLVISIFMLTALLSTTFIQAKGIIIEYDQPEVAVVIDVIDGEAIKVMHINSYATKDKVEFIRLIGVDSMANDDTYEYMKDQLLGKVVFILYDENNLPITDNYRNAYVFVNTDQSINETLLTYGYAVLDESYSLATYYDDLVKAEYYAIRQEKGIHKVSTTPSNIININLASSVVLQEHFDISSSVAASIISYRSNNPINDSRELGFINDELNKDFILSHRAGIHYTTNINDASQYELSTLFSLGNASDFASRISRNRIFNPYTNIDELKDLTSISYYYSIIEPYITTESINNLYIDEELLVANINTASETELVEASGMSTYYANKIIDFRTSTGYYFRSLEELSKVNFPFNYMNMTAYLDNLTFATEINDASDFELRTLLSQFHLGESLEDYLMTKIKIARPFYNYSDVESTFGNAFYNEIESFLYIEGVNNSGVTPININSATRDDVINYLNLDSDDSQKFSSHINDYTNVNDLNYLSAENMKSITLYTNVNTATYDELLKMNRYMTASIVNAIIEYRSYYPFYNLDELNQVFDDLNKLNVYELIKNEVVFY